MTYPVAIATADRELGEVLRTYLLAANMEEVSATTVAPDPLTDTGAVRDWLDSRDKTLLVLDPELPAAGATRDPFDRSGAVKTLQKELEETGIDTPTLVMTPGQRVYEDVERACTPARRSIALPINQLRKHRQAILRPFLAMLLGKPDNKGAIPGSFRVIEVDFRDTVSRCALGFEDGTLLVWESSCQVDGIRKVVPIYASDQFYKANSNWPMIARRDGEVLFNTHVVEALGDGLFGHIERAAGGLVGLSFRFFINDPSLYLAPFEASVRPMLNEDGKLVVLHAPVARRLPISGMMRVARRFAPCMPRPTRLLFVRSQMGEHPDGKTNGDICDLVVPAVDGGGKTKSLQFTPLQNIDAELSALRELSDRSPARLQLDVLDLSQCPPGAAASVLENRLKTESYEIIHYAGHAWSELDGVAYLILPGTEVGKASSLDVSTFAGFERVAETRLVYLSACRGISRGSVQNLVAQGIQYGVGFRYEVEDDKAALFATTFYGELFDCGFISPAFRAAFAAARQRLRTEGESHIWLSPILVAQAADWAMRA